MPKTQKRDDTEYISLDSLCPFEREVFDLTLAALALPLTPRQQWFAFAAKNMRHANEYLAPSLGSTIN